MGKQIKNGWIKIPAGTKKLFGFGPKITKYEKFIKKTGSFVPIVFSPRDYEINDPIQAKKLAYEHAKKQKDFYQDLINKGVYPVGTKVKIRRWRHSEKYLVNMFMPKIKDCFQYPDPVKEDKKHKGQVHEILAKIKGTMQKYNAEHVLKEDLSRGYNYGIDPKTGKIAYLDYHVGEVSDPNSDKLKRNLRGLERHLVIAIIGIFTGMFLLSSNLTGNFISNLNQFSSNFIGSLLFIVSLTGFFVYFKKKHKIGS
jgi:hypothetical protein